MNEDDVKLALALLEQDCPDAYTEHGRPRHEREGWSCILCHNTGKVPLLDLREPCGCPCSIDRRRGWVSPCPSRCEGRGWLPSDDVMDWVRALNKAGYAVTFIHDGRAQVDNLTDLHFIWGQGATLFEAAAQALGVTDKETP